MPMSIYITDVRPSPSSFMINIYYQRTNVRQDKGDGVRHAGRDREGLGVLLSYLLLVLLY